MQYFMKSIIFDETSVSTDEKGRPITRALLHISCLLLVLLGHFAQIIATSIVASLIFLYINHNTSAYFAVWLSVLFILLVLCSSVFLFYYQIRYYHFLIIDTVCFILGCILALMLIFLIYSLITLPPNFLDIND